MVSRPVIVMKTKNQTVIMAEVRILDSHQLMVDILAFVCGMGIVVPGGTEHIFATHVEGSNRPAISRQFSAFWL